MNKTKQIIVRMTDNEKRDLENIAKDTETNVSRFIRNLINEYIQEKQKGKITQ